MKLRARRTTFLLFILTWLHLTVWNIRASDPLDTWYWRNPLPQANSLLGVCHGQGWFVAVGAQGTILKSLDGRNWVPRESGTYLPLRDICHGGGLFVAVGDYGTILTSPDANTWTAQDPAWFFTLNSVTWGNGRFVAVGDETSILSSTNGVDWELEGWGTMPLADVTFGNGRFIAVGGMPGTRDSPNTPGPGTNLVLVSINGQRWNRATLNSPGNLTAIAAGNGVFVAALSSGPYPITTLWCSTDGLVWEPVSHPPLYWAPFDGLCFDGQKFWGFGSSQASLWGPYGWGSSALHSTDGRHWEMEALNTFAGINSATSDGRSVVAVGDQSPAGTIAIVNRSPAGFWRDSVVQRDLLPSRIAYLGGKFIGTFNLNMPEYPHSAGRVALSTNGGVWVNRLLATNADFSLIGWGDGTYVATGEPGWSATSPDGENWSVHQNDLTEYLTALAFGNGCFLATAAHAVYRSTNGIHWTLHEIEGAPLATSLTFGLNRFFLTDGNNGHLLESADGIWWNQVIPANATTFNAIAFWEDRLMARANDTQYHVSTNARDWNLIWSDRPGAGALASAYGYGRYVISTRGNYGGYYSTAQSDIWSSTNGVDWTRHPMRASHMLWSLAFGNNTVVVHDGGNQILQSAPLVDSPPQIAGPPAPVAIAPGNDASLSASIIATPPFDCTWFKDGIVVPNLHDPVLVLTNLAEGETHDVSVTVSNAFGVAHSPAARVVAGVPARLEISSGTAREIRLLGTPGLTYRIEQRESEISPFGWSGWTNLIPSGSGATATLPFDAESNRFYRAVLTP